MTTSISPERPDAAPGTEPPRGNRAKVVAVAAVLMMVLGSLLAHTVQTSAGSVSVTTTTIFGAEGHRISAQVYLPDDATAENPLPGVAVWHGLNNQKEYMSNTALELARRGFVVVSADQTGHGSSSGANQDVGCGGPDVLTYLRDLPAVDTERVGLVGMSQGGFCAATAAAMAQPDAYSSIFYLESEPTPPGVMDATPFVDLRNVGVAIGTWTELGVMIAVDKGANAGASPVLMPVFGTDEPIVAEQLYGSIEDGTGRMLYTPWENHALSTDSTDGIGTAVDWMQRTLLADDGGLDTSDQVWPVKLLGTTIALAGAFLFLFAAGSLLLRTRAFATLVRPVPEYRGLTGGAWWFGALLTTAVGPLLYLWVWKNMFFDPILPANAVWPQTFTNAFMVWAVIVGAITWALIGVNHAVTTRRHGATLANYGLTEPDRRFDWRALGRSALLVLAILAPVYLVLAFVSSAWGVDFRLWLVTLMPMTGARLGAFAGYLLPFAIFFFAQAIIFGGFLRWKKGKAPLWQEMLVNSIVLTLGAFVWLLLVYVPLMSGGTILFGSDPVTVTSAGMGAINYTALLVLWPLSACLYTSYFRRTGRVFVGSILVTTLVVWSLTAANDFGVLPLLG
ncbi:alpha/beta fold hydrolase [Cellulomonas sp. APG4]|uniref:alpha/beta hydrolase n=1 Tax=Cellulomonas sp. APG4 TaxID=1538656 RepID=UPI00137B8A7C|nr:alpha/beta fold hydrolase [Cellulomonas sp. APG4]NCT90480.1 alpha/beta fold hydrolase [Cellulomonas sp. APG4]